MLGNGTLMINIMNINIAVVTSVSYICNGGYTFVSACPHAQDY